MQIKSSKILDGYEIIIVYPDDKEYQVLKPLFKVYGLALTDVRSNIVYVDGGAFDELNLDNDHLDAIDAHEMAHIILGHGIKDPSSTEEMEADYLAILMLNAMEYGEAASILIDDFQGRHGIIYEDVEEKLDTQRYDMIFAFISRYFPDVDVMNEDGRLTKEFFDILLEQKLNESKQRLIEGRVEEAQKYADTLGVSPEIFEYIKTESESINKQHKYLMWILEQVEANNLIDTDKINTEILEHLRYFHSHASQFAQKDIYAYGELRHLIQAIDEVKSKERRVFKERYPGEKIFENEKIEIFCPLTMNSSCYYGTGTKWCTTMREREYFGKYKLEGELYYVLSKTKPTIDQTYKMAIRFKFESNEVGYVIAEIRDAVNDRLVPTAEFVEDVGQEGYNAIIEDLNKRHEIEIEGTSYLKLQKRWENDPKDFLNKLPYKSLLSFLTQNGVILGGITLCKLLAEHNIHPMSKPDLRIEDYYNYLLTVDHEQALKQFVNEYSQFNDFEYPEALTQHFIKPEEIPVYFKLNNPEHWGRDMGVTVLHWYDTNRSDGKGELSYYLSALDLDFSLFWKDWNGVAGLLNYIDQEHPNYMRFLFTNREYTHLKSILQSAIKYGENITGIYDSLIPYTDKYDTDIFKIITSKSWHIGFNKEYGTEEGPRKLIPFLLKNGIDVFDYLEIDALGEYYGSINEVIKAAIEHYTQNDDDESKLLGFLKEKIDLKDQIGFFEWSKKYSDDDALKNLLNLYGADIFDYYTINDLTEATSEDVEFLEKVFTATSPDLQKVFYSNVSDIQMFDVYNDRLSDKELTEEERLEYRKKAFDITKMRDVRLNADGKIDLICNGWGDFVDWFYDGETGYSRANPYYVAKKLLTDDLDWEPYYDVVQDWNVQIWDDLDEETKTYVKSHIKEKILPVDIYPDDIDLNVDGWDIKSEDGSFRLTSKILDAIDDDDLGLIIEKHDEFDDLKNEMKWAYESAYNNAIRDEWYEQYTDEIIDLLSCGGPKWEKTGKVTKHTYKTKDGEHSYENEEQIFVLPNIAFFDLTQKWANEYKNYPDEVFQYDFIGMVGNYLSEYDSPLKPDPSEYPSDRKVTEYFIDDLKNRI